MKQNAQKKTLAPLHITPRAIESGDMPLSAKRLYQIGFAGAGISLAMAIFNVIPIGTSQGFGTPKKMALGLAFALVAFSFSFSTRKTAAVIGRAFHSSAFYWGLLLSAIGLVLISDALVGAAIPLVAKLTGVFLVFLALPIAAHRLTKTRRSFLLENFLFVFSTVLLLGGAELMAGFFSPKWPSRLLRPHLPGSDYMKAEYNSWGMMDSERTIERTPGKDRVLFIGDSFMEVSFAGRSLAQFVEADLRAGGNDKTEVINLGIASTGPASYYYRLKKFGLQLKPDAIFVFVFAGNDFIEPQHAFGKLPFKIVGETPLPSLFGSLLPRLNWVIVDRLRLSEFGKSGPNTMEEFNLLNKYIELPYEQARVPIAEHFQKTYYPQESTEKLLDILDIGGKNLWARLKDKPDEPEYLQTWILKGIFSFHLAKNAGVKNLGAVPSENIAATSSYLQEMQKLAREQNITFKTVTIPIGFVVDPQFRELWSAWSGNPNPQDPHLAVLDLIKDLSSRQISTYDLATPMNGVPGTYRYTDGHWTKFGHQVAAQHLAKLVSDTLEEKK